MIKTLSDGISYVVSGQKVCAGTCLKYKAPKLRNRTMKEAGVKMCIRCETMMKYDGVWCPCCKNRLRTKSRNRNRDNRGAVRI